MKGFYYIFFALLLCSYCVKAEEYCWDSTWYNDSVTLKNGTNYEHQSVDILEKVCPNGAAVIAAQCKDIKNESFTGFKNDTYNRNILTCHHITGLICKPYENDPNATCPDYAIQYGCKCPPSTPSGGITRSMTKTPGTVTTNKGHLDKGNGDTPHGTTPSEPPARKTSVGRTINVKTEGGNCTGNSTNGSKSATSSRQHRCRNSTQSFENVGLLLVLTFFWLIFLLIPLCSKH